MTLEDEVHRGKTTGYIYSGQTAVGIFSLSDACRSGAQEAIRELKLLGIKTAMLTGDCQSAAMQAQEQLAHALELVHAELLPEDKVKIVSEFKKKGPTAMIGDGLNDAPALATADIGISMGISGSALASETGNIILMSNDLRKIPEAIKIARKSRRKVIENIILSVITKVAILGLAIAGHPIVWAAVLADVGTCLLVILNSMLLLRSGHNHGGKCCGSSTQQHNHKNGCGDHHHHHHQHQHNDQKCASDKAQHQKCASKSCSSKCSPSPSNTTLPQNIHQNGCDGTNGSSSHHDHHHHHHHHQHQHQHEHQQQHHSHRHCGSDKVQPQKCEAKSCSSKSPPCPSNTSLSGSVSQESHDQCKGSNEFHESDHCHHGRCDKSQDGVQKHDENLSLCGKKESQQFTEHCCHLNHCDENLKDHGFIHNIEHKKPGCCDSDLKKQGEGEISIDIMNEHVVCGCEGLNEKEVSECCENEGSSKETTDTCIVKACISLDKREVGGCCKSYMKECCGKHGHSGAGFVGGLSEIITE